MPAVDECRERLRRAGWSLGEAAAGAAWVVDGRNGENLILAVGASPAEAWRQACEQARRCAPCAWCSCSDSPTWPKPGGVPVKLRHNLVALAAAAAAWLAPSTAQEAKVNVKVHLAAEHAPEGLKAGARADLKMVLSSAKTKTGKVTYRTSPLAEGVEVVSVKREEKPKDPDKAVLVELLVTKAQAEKIREAKARLVA